MARAESIQIVSHEAKRRQVVAIGIPSLGMVSLQFLKAFYLLRMPTNRLTVHIYVEGKEVGDARNEIVARAEQWQADNADHDLVGVFFLDDDVLPHPEALVKLLDVDRPIVSGLYYMKYQVATPLVLLEPGTGAMRSWRPGEIVECDAHGMGLTYVAMEVFRRVRAERDLGTDRFGYPCWFKTIRDAQVTDAFGRRVVTNVTEDAFFLEHARACGYRPAVDTSAQAFGWHWHQRERRAYPLKQWTEFQQTGRITWDTDDGPVVWEAAA